jgi:dihydroorotate dehydrogenase
MTRGKADLSVEIGQIKLKNPVVAAAGTFPEMTAEKLLGRSQEENIGGSLR